MSPRLCSIQTRLEALRRLGRTAAVANRREVEAARGANMAPTEEGSGLAEEKALRQGVALRRRGVLMVR